jgi:alcohol dehydrogenase class IV
MKEFNHKMFFGYAFLLLFISKFGLKEKIFPSIVKKSQESSSMKGNPILLTDREITEILKKTIE